MRVPVAIIGLGVLFKFFLETNKVCNVWLSCSLDSLPINFRPVRPNALSAHAFCQCIYIYATNRATNLPKKLGPLLYSLLTHCQKQLFKHPYIYVIYPMYLVVSWIFDSDNRCDGDFNSTVEPSAVPDTICIRYRYLLLGSISTKYLLGIERKH